MNHAPTFCRVWAPATVANLNVGFDALGCALCTPGEFMAFKRLDEYGVHLVNGPGTDLPLDVESNVAGKAAASLLQALDNPFGVEVTVTKSIMPGSGIGSSAASAVAAVVGVDALADAGMRKEELLPFALDGEAVASGARHADNVAPALMGGLTLIDPDGKVCALPVPLSWHLVVLHPQVVIKTSESRAALPPKVSLTDATHQGKFRASTKRMSSNPSPVDAKSVNRSRRQPSPHPLQGGTINNARFERSANRSSEANAKLCWCRPRAPAKHARQYPSPTF